MHHHIIQRVVPGIYRACCDFCRSPEGVSTFVLWLSPPAHVFTSDVEVSMIAPGGLFNELTRLEFLITKGAESSRPLSRCLRFNPHRSPHERQGSLPAGPLRL